MGEVQELIRSLSLLTETDIFLKAASEGIKRLFGADLVLVLVQERGHGDFTPHYSLGLDPDALARAGFSRRGKLVRQLETESRCLDLGRQLQMAESLDFGERELIARLRVQVCLPLVSLGRLLGIILLGSTELAWSLERQELDLLEILAAQSAVALENSLLHSQQRDRLLQLYRSERLATAGRLAAGVAHEIRNPLTVISSTVQYLVEGSPPDDPRRALAEALLAEVARLDRTVESLLSLARERNAPRTKIDLREPLDRSLLLTEAQARQRGIVVERSVEGSLPILGDPDEVEQVFLNLLLNALQASEEGGRIIVTAGLRENSFNPSDRGVEIQIADAGCGIPEADLERVFEPFFTTKREGSGLGLPTVLSIIEGHDGEINLRSKVGRGTTVCMRFPWVE